MSKLKPREELIYQMGILRGKIKVLVEINNDIKDEDTDSYVKERIEELEDEIREIKQTLGLVKPQLVILEKGKMFGAVGFIINEHGTITSNHFQLFYQWSVPKTV